MREDAEESSRTGNSGGAEEMSEKEIDANLEETFPASVPTVILTNEQWQKIGF